MAFPVESARMFTNSIKLKLFLLLLCLTAVPLAAQVPTPTGSPSPTPTLAPNAVPSLPELQDRIRQHLARSEVRRGRVGVKIVSLNSGRVVFENDAEKYFMPASNMKNFTVATALERLTPDYRFVTSVYAATPPDAGGTIKGDLRIFGRGDVSMSPAFFAQVQTTGDAAKASSESAFYIGIDRLVDRIIQAGVKRVEGGLVGDESYFTGNPIPWTWEWDDLQGYYGTEISALPINDNAVDLSVMPGARGSSCVVRILPFNQVTRIVNRCVTTAAGTRRELRVVKPLDQNVVEVYGSVPVGDAEHKESVAVTRPANLFIELLRQRLEARGVKITGQNRVENALSRSPRSCTNCSPINASEIARLESPPFSEIAARTMKPSQNMYTETILWTLGEVVGRALGKAEDSARLGINVMKEFLGSIGIPADGIVPYDGSGLSRHNLITPAAVVSLYTYMAKQSKYAQAWRDSLTIAGVDGTLRNRMKGTAAQANFRGKTGTIDQVSALSGYMTTAGGEQLVVSILVNGVPTTRERTSLIDDIVVTLANFNGRIDQ